MSIAVPIIRRHRPELVEDRAPLRGDPADNPVLAADGAVLDIVSGAPRRVRRRFVAGQHAVAVVRVEAGLEIRPCDRDVGRDAEHRLDQLRPEQIAGHEIDIPQPDLARLGRQPELFLAPPQLGFRLAAGFVQPGLFERDGGLFRDPGDNRLVRCGEPVRFGWPRKIPPITSPPGTDDRDREIADHRQMAQRRALVRRVLP